MTDVKSSDSTFESKIDDEELSIVLFNSNTCDKCIEIKSILTSVSLQKVHVHIIDVFKDCDIAQKYSIRILPTIIIFSHGLVSDVVAGQKSRNFYKNYFAKLGVVI